MKRDASLRLAALSVALAGAILGAACTSSPEEVVIIENVPVDSVVFWPPTLRYAHTGDTLSLEMRGVKRQRKCATIRKLGWDFRRDSTGAEYFTPSSEFETRSSCGADPVGLDTLFKAQVFTLAGRKFYLQTPDGRLTDSVLFVSSGPANRPAVDTLLHMPASGDTTALGRYVFRDSTAAHPRRVVEAESLQACELLQAAVFERLGDTLRVRVRRLRAGAALAEVLPACAGPHADTLEVVPALHGFP